MKLTEATLYENKSHRILKEGWQDLTESQKLYQGRFEKELWPLVEQYTKLAEAELSRQQVLDIFSGAEQVAMDSGDNKTIAGKVGAGAAAAAKLPVDIAKKVDAKINELGKLAQNAGPVKNADAKFAQLKKDITANNSDSKIVQGVQKISDWAKANPGKASVAVGILTTMAAFAGGPAGGAAAGLVLRASKDLLQGEELSAAVGKSIKTGVYGALAGMAFSELTDNIVDNISSAQGAELEAMEASLKAENLATAKADLFADLGMEVDVLDGATRIDMSGNLNGFYYSYDTVIPPDMMGQYEALSNAVSSADTFSPEHYAAAAKFHDFMGGLVDAPEAKNLTAAWDALKEIPKEQLTTANLDTLLAQAESSGAVLTALNDAGGAIAAAAQGALQTVDDTAKDAHKAKPVDPEIKQQLELDLKGGSNAKAESMSMEERFELYLAEADPAQGELPLDNPNTMGAKLKRGAGKLAGKAAGAVKGAASSAAGAVKQGAKDVGNKVTANKLTKTWKSMGEPTDAGSIANILADAGVSNDQIAQISKTANVKLQPTPKSTAADPKAAAKATATAKATAKDPKAAAAEPKSAISKGANKATATKPMKKGTTKEVGGKTYRWEGALWVDTATNKPVSVANAMKMGLGNPKLDPIISAAKKDPALAKLIKQQITSKGVKAGTAQAAKAAQPDAKNKVAPKAAPAASVAPKAAPTANVAPKAAATKKTAAKAAPAANVATAKSGGKLKKAAGAVKSGYKNYNKMSALNPGS